MLLLQIFIDHSIEEINQWTEEDIQKYHSNGDMETHLKEAIKLLKEIKKL